MLETVGHVLASSLGPQASNLKPHEEDRRSATWTADKLIETLDRIADPRPVARPPCHWPEQVDLPDGQDIMITIITSPSNQDSDAFRKSAGRWQGTLDADTLIRNIYTDRLLSNRPASAL